MIKSRIIYVAILIASFIFSQALYDSISLFTMVCVILLPILSGILMLLCKSTVGIRSRLAQSRVCRYQQTTMLVEIKCGAPFLSPLMQLECVINDPEGKESVIRRLPVGFSPFSKTVIEIPLRYTYRGKYEVGIRSVEIYDFLRLFKIKHKIDQNYKLYVTPRFLPSEIHFSQDIYLEDGTSTDVLAATNEGAELFGVRDYTDDDSLRHVHWNLSAAKGDLLVKTYSVNRQHQMYILLDLTDKDHRSLRARRLGDAMVETALSLCRDLLDRVGSVCLMWQRGSLHECSVDSPQGLSVAYEEMGLCPMQSEKMLDRSLGEISNVQALCIVTGRLDEQKLSRVEILQNSLHCPIHLFAFENTCSAETQALSAKNITLRMLNLDEIEKGRVI
ncbi:MAG: DUF58 domain-containing protein [Clostridia bacterium]|nr:DUF58 domain-containing protein [Clostridia bacterium]